MTIIMIINLCIITMIILISTANIIFPSNDGSNIKYLGLVAGWPKQKAGGRMCFKHDLPHDVG